MTAALDALPARLSELSRLASLLANHVVDGPTMGRPIPDDHIRSLLEAALLLREYGQELPSLLSQIMHRVDETEPEAAAEAQAKAGLPPSGSGA